MTKAHSTYWRIAFALTIPAAFAQKCYYPNGKEAPEKPCSSAEGSACCPDKWECLDNGLCHYPPDKLWGRYSCTDQTWKAEGCPSNLCTYDMKDAIGGESITQCADHDNQWCCNADAQHVNCCKESPTPRPFFALADGKAYATVGASTASSAPNLATITGRAIGRDSGSSAATTGSNSPQSTDPSSTTPAPTSADPTTQLQTSLSTGTTGIITVIRTVVTTPSPTGLPSEPSPSNSKKSKLPIIVGCALGIPLGLALLGILIWLLRKRSQQDQHNKNPYSDSPLTHGDSPHSEHAFIGGAKHNEKPPVTTYASTNGASELADNAVGPGRPISTIQGHAELDSGTAFQPGAQAPHSPHFVGLGGGTGYGHTPHTSWSSAPNRDSVAVPTSPLSGHNEADGRPISLAATGLPRPISGPPPGGYVPYRPNNLVQTQAHELGTGSGSSPLAQELSAVQTPPAVELSSVRTPPT